MAGKINESLEKVKESIIGMQSFVLEAGAGSGKTWTLIESLKFLLETKAVELEKQSQKIACITYTNIAKDQITERLDFNDLVEVSTIHEFLWFIIKNYQQNLKTEILDYNESDTKKHISGLEDVIEDTRIEYSQYGRKFEKGQLTHEDILHFSNKLFSNFPKISKLVANKFPYIFIDEYQDTELRTVEIFLDYLRQLNNGKVVIGFFGDSMQKIYNSGVGKIPQKYIDDKSLTVITKTENFRCSLKVIDLLNKIRPSLTQVASGKNLSGNVTFISCNKYLHKPEENYRKTLDWLDSTRGWKIEENTKILLLTHRGIANKLGYEKLLAIYDMLDFGRDRLFNREEIFSNFILESIEDLVRLYQNENYRSFIQKLGIIGFKLNYHEDKSKIRKLMDELILLRQTGTVLEVLKYVFENNLLAKPLKIQNFLSEIERADLDETQQLFKRFYESLVSNKYGEFILLQNYIDKHTPYSTKHGVKGAEYENVLVVIDDSSWNLYKFNDVFSSSKSNIGRYERTLNLLYVCCSRAKNNLTILSLSEMDSAALGTIKNWFGVDKFMQIENL
ncbi:MAG: UvrD-helicase domain-containing protein [Flavobacteriaceae bacterium]|nr:UvrD-helicase domain-containing protein [Flavobacteriaceae bacterium]